jgi:hypothetical protein
MTRKALRFHKQLIAFAFCAALLQACQNRMQYWDVSKFNIKVDALQNDEPIKLLYSSRGPSNNEDLAFFIHVIVVSQKSGDTVNILTTVDNGFEENSGDEVYNFVSDTSMIGKIFHTNPEVLEKITHVSEIESLATPDLRKIRKVVRDTKFDEIADNNFPTIVGWIGKTGNVNDLPK